SDPVDCFGMIIVVYGRVTGHFGPKATDHTIGVNRENSHPRRRSVVGARRIAGGLVEEVVAWLYQVFLVVPKPTPCLTHPTCFRRIVVCSWLDVRRASKHGAARRCPCRLVK